MVILSAIQELHRYKLTVNLNHVMDLFDNAQQRVFSEIVPYWGTFCRMYQSPVESTTSLPEGNQINYKTIDLNRVIIYSGQEHSYRQ